MARLDIEPGGEYLLGYAKKRLQELKQRIVQFPASAKTETTQGPNGERIVVSSFGGDDRISIKGGESFWFGDAEIPTTTPPVDPPTDPEVPVEL